jgi:hypothetical protein
MCVFEDCHNANHVESIGQKSERLAIFVYHGEINSPLPIRELSEEAIA